MTCPPTAMSGSEFSSFDVPDPSWTSRPGSWTVANKRTPIPVAYLTYAGFEATLNMFQLTEEGWRSSQTSEFTFLPGEAHVCPSCITSSALPECLGRSYCRGVRRHAGLNHRGMYHGDYHARSECGLHFHHGRQCRGRHLGLL